jgi:hypothetical protein
MTIRLWGNPLTKKNSFTPGQLTTRPFLKTLVSSALLFKCSSCLNLFLPSGPGRLRPEPLIGLFLVCNGKFIPSLGPAAFQYKPPPLGFHPCPKTELAVPFYLAGLISSLHGNYSSIFQPDRPKIGDLALGSTGKTHSSKTEFKSIGEK